MSTVIREIQRWVGALWLAAIVVAAVLLGKDGVWWVLATAVGGIVLGALFLKLAPSPARPGLVADDDPSATGSPSPLP